MYQVINLDWRDKKTKDLETRLDNKIYCEDKNYSYCGIASENEYETKEHKRISDYISKIVEGKVQLDKVQLDGDLIQEECFGSVHADIFLSHSHSDKGLALRIKKLLKEKYGLEVFVDSCVWAYCNNILREIDDEYCVKKGYGNYDYEKRNGTTAMVHMMLSNAITKMMDRTECIFFLNTNKSNFNQACTDEETTASPWIYHELSTLHIMRRTTPPRKEKNGVCFEKVTEATEMLNLEILNLEMLHTIDMSNLPSLNFYDFDKWTEKVNYGKHSLDELYDMLLLG